jgi:hypothetical protein
VFDVRQRPDPRPVVPDAHDQAIVLGPGADLQHAVLVLVGVSDDVHAGLRDHGLEVGHLGGLHLQRLGQPGERVPDERHVRSSRGNRELDSRLGVHHSLSLPLHVGD